ncbi:hypothetical protein [Pacificoceanicola onchidii]|uniref:hypothetical protein n=1 Tax=Pacificoceanicola onchidii TaxID=2562685 RepID=UPI0010A39313|nr:hypothetical protein [Pacificoceanicola onchidii]
MTFDTRKHTPKHLARNLHEDFVGVCERIRLAYAPKRQPRNWPSPSLRRLLGHLGRGDDQPEEQTRIAEEISEVTVRFLAIKKTIDQTVPVQSTHDTLKSLLNALRKTSVSLEDADRDVIVTALRASQDQHSRAPTAAQIWKEESLIEKVDATAKYIQATMDDLSAIVDLFDYKNDIRGRGRPSLYAKVFAVHALAAIYEKENADGHKAQVNEVVNNGRSDLFNERRYTGGFLRFVTEFYVSVVPEEVVGRHNDGFADHVRQLARNRDKDPNLISLMMGQTVTVEQTLEFMKRADAVK